MDIETLEIWQGWSFQKEYLIDNANNKYNILDIRAMFFEKQLSRNILGNPYDITCLKSALEEKLIKLNSEIVIQLVNNGKCIQEERIVI